MPEEGPTLRLLIACIAVLARTAMVAPQPGTVPAEVLRDAQEYLVCTEGATEQALARRLDACSLDPQSVVRALRPQPSREVKSGYFAGEHFRSPELRKRYPDDLLYYVVPDSYRPEAPTGLVILMHGGSKGMDRKMAHWYMRTDGKGSQLGEAFAAAGLIAVGPSAPVHPTCYERWCLPEADDYIRDVVIEFQCRFNIDPDRVILMGHSMGGFGAYHHLQVQPDRFAAVLVSAGSWYLAYWPVIEGTPLWIVHGLRDSEPGGRPRYTDVAFARTTHRLLTEKGLAHEYREHSRGHSIPYGRDDIRHFIARMPAMRRDPFHPRVVVVTPRGWRPSDRRRAPHNRWVTILEQTEGKLTYDCLRHEGARQFWGMPRKNWEDWRLVHFRREYPGAMVKATNQGANRFEVTTRNVRRFSLWLHHKMVDFSKPVRVTVNGSLRFDRRITPSVSAALRSYRRRMDWGLIYTAEVPLTADE